MKNIDGQTILITGGTGSFGHAFVKHVLTKGKPKKVIVLSRDELKQYDMKNEFGDSNNDHPILRFFLGDVRDQDRLRRAFEGVDIVVHAAALKQVPTLEYNPIEAVKTNIVGAENIINAAIDQNVKKVIALSTDKAANPINLYGATKLCAEKLFVAGNSYSGGNSARFSVVRYGNVVGSRGSVVPFFLNKRASGVLPITDERMTRFWITLPQAVDFVLASLDRMQGGEIFIPKIPSVKVLDLAKAIGPGCRIKTVGIRPGEKLHETLLTEEESRHSQELPTAYVIHPEHVFWKRRHTASAGKKVTPGFTYASDTNSKWLGPKQVLDLIQDFSPRSPSRIERRGASHQTVE